MHLRRSLLALFLFSVACGDDDVAPDASMVDAATDARVEGAASVAIVQPLAGARVLAGRTDVRVAFDAGEASTEELTLELRAGGGGSTTVPVDRSSGEQDFPDVVLYTGDAPEAEVGIGVRLLSGDEVLASTAVTVVVSLSAEARGRLESAAPGTTIGHDPSGTPRRLTTDLTLSGATPEARARDFLEEYGLVFGVDAAEARLARSRPLEVGDASRDRVILRQVHAGLEVIGARAALTLEGDRLLGGTFRWASGLGPLPTRLIGPREAITILAGARGVSDPQLAGEPRLGWWDDRVSLPVGSRPEVLRAPEPVWQLRLPVSPASGESFTLHAFVGAVSGEVLESWSTSRGDAPRLTTHDLEGTRHADCQSSSLFSYVGFIECSDGFCSSEADGYTRRTHSLARRAGIDLDALDRGLTSFFGYGAPSRLQLFARDRDPDDGDAGPAGSYDSQCDFIRIGSDESTPRLLAHEMAHAFIEESAGLANEGGSGAVAEGLAYFFASHVVGESGGERCELTCEDVEPRFLRLTFADYVVLRPNETHGNGRVVQMPLELLASGGRYPELRTDPLTPDGTYAGIGPDAAAEVAALALALGAERDGLLDFFEHVLDAAALLESGGTLDEGQKCTTVLVVAETAFTRESWAHTLFSDGSRQALLTSCLDGDPDGDLIPSDEDLCPLLTGDDQSADLDGDGIGDECDLDRDGDGTPNESDLCPELPTAERIRRDLDGDGLGDPCDEDDDGDGVPDDEDACPTFPGEDATDCADDDGDGLINGRDPCPELPLFAGNDLSDADGDGLGAACDDDDDGDGVPDDEDLCPGVDDEGTGDSDGDGLGDGCDLCPTVADADEQVDTDWDGLGDRCDDDDDDDGVPDGSDNCPAFPNPGQQDYDDNGQGFACDGSEVRRVLTSGLVSVFAEADVSVTLPLCQEDCSLEAATEGGWSITLALPAEAEVAPAVVGSFGEVIAWLEPQGGEPGGDVVYTGEFVVGEADLAMWGEELSWTAPTYSLVLDPAGNPELSLPGPMVVELLAPGQPAESCGDADAGPGEVCDGSDLRELRCTTLGFDSGTLACDGSCTFDTSACGRCGDGVRSSDETCDGSDFGGDSCEARGYVGGSLGCDGGCASVSEAGCTPCTTQDSCTALGADACLDTGRCGSCASNADCPDPFINCTVGACLPPF